MNKNYDFAINVPLKIVNAGSSYCLKYRVPQKVRVVFVGRGSDLFRLSFFNLRYSVDISGVKRKLKVNLIEHPEFVQFPEEISVKVKSIARPQELDLEVDKCRQKKVPVRAMVSLKTKDGYTLVGITAQPDTIVVNGPASYVDTLKYVKIIKNMDSDIAAPFQTKIPVKQTKNFYAKYIPQQVQLSFDIQRIAEKAIENVPVEVIHTPPNYDVVPLPSFVNLYLRGGEKILAGARPEDFKVVIDFRRDWRPGNDKIKSHVETKLNLLFTEARPSQFELIVQKKGR